MLFVLLSSGVPHFIILLHLTSEIGTQENVGK